MHVCSVKSVRVRSVRVRSVRISSAASSGRKSCGLGFESPLVRAVGKDRGLAFIIVLNYTAYWFETVVSSIRPSLGDVGLSNCRV